MESRAPGDSTGARPRPRGHGGVPAPDHLAVADDEAERLAPARRVEGPRARRLLDQGVVDQRRGAVRRHRREPTGIVDLGAQVRRHERRDLPYQTDRLLGDAERPVADAVEGLVAFAGLQRLDARLVALAVLRDAHRGHFVAARSLHRLVDGSARCAQQHLQLLVCCTRVL